MFLNIFLFLEQGIPGEFVKPFCRMGVSQSALQHVYKMYILYVYVYHEMNLSSCLKHSLWHWKAVLCSVACRPDLSRWVLLGFYCYMIFHWEKEGLRSHLVLMRLVFLFCLLFHSKHPFLLVHIVFLHNVVLFINFYSYYRPLTLIRC